MTNVEGTPGGRRATSQPVAQFELDFAGEPALPRERIVRAPRRGSLGLEPMEPAAHTGWDIAGAGTGRVRSAAVADPSASASGGDGASVPGFESKREGPAILRKLKAETGLGLSEIQYCVRNFPGDPIRQVGEFFERFHIPAATGRKRTASRKTDKAYRDRMMAVVKKLREMNMRIQNLTDLTPKQIRKLFLQMETEGWSSSWMCNTNTTVRRFGIWIGKPDLCPRLPEMVKNPWSSQRRVSAAAPKSWGDVGVDKEMVLAQVELECPVTALQLRLAAAFGVRVQEFVMFKPLQAEHDGRLYIREGTKGGRPRSIPIETDEQRELLEQAKELADKHPKGLVVAKHGLSLKQALSYHYNLLHRLGVSKRQLGVTTHGLRHGYACKVYKELTGQEAPVLGGAAVEPALDQKVRLEIAERLGHGRASVTSAYLGSHVMLRKMCRENLQRLQSVLEGDQVLRDLAAKGGFEFFGAVAMAAAGESVQRSGALNLGFRALALDSETQAQADERAAPVASAMAVRAGQLFGVAGMVSPLAWMPADVQTFELSALCTMPVGTQGAGKP